MSSNQGERNEYIQVECSSMSEVENLQREKAARQDSAFQNQSEEVDKCVSGVDASPGLCSYDHRICYLENELMVMKRNIQQLVAERQDLTELEKKQDRHRLALNKKLDSVNKKEFSNLMEQVQGHLNQSALNSFSGTQDLKNNVQKLVDQNISLKDQILQLKQNFKEENEQLKQSLKEENEVLMNQQESLKNSNQQLDTEKISLKNQIGQLIDENQDLKNQVMELNANSKNIELLEQISELKIALEKQNLKQHHFEEKFQTILEQQKNLEVENSRLKSLVDQFQNQHNQVVYQQQKISYEFENQIKQAVFDQNQFTLNKIEPLNDENQQIQEKVQNLIDSNEIIDQKYTQLNQQLFSLQNMVHELQEKIVDKNENLEKQDLITQLQSSSIQQQQKIEELEYLQCHKMYKLNEFIHDISTGNVQNATLNLTSEDFFAEQKSNIITIPIVKKTSVYDLTINGPNNFNRFNRPINAGQRILFVTSHPIKFVNCNFNYISVEFEDQTKDTRIFLNNISCNESYLCGLYFLNFQQVKATKINIKNSEQNGFFCQKCKLVKLNLINASNCKYSGIKIIQCGNTLIQESIIANCMSGIIFWSSAGQLFQCKMSHCKTGATLQNSLVYQNSSVCFEENEIDEDLCSNSKWLSKIENSFLFNSFKSQSFRQ